MVTYSSFGLCCFGLCAMSRRRISCKDLGLADCQGWLYKKKEKGGFIGNKWKKFWCVLKSSSLYWYSNQLAEKAEGFLSLPDFTVEPATECKKKYAMKIIHPQIKTFYFAAENVEEMNIWLKKLGVAVLDKQANKKNEEECYSESEHEDPEINVETPPPPYADQLRLPHSDQQEPSLASHASSEVSSSLPSPENTIESKGSSSSSLPKVLYPERQSRLDLVNSSSTGDEMDNQPLAVSDESQETDYLMTSCSKTLESGTAKPECSVQISSNEDGSTAGNAKSNQAMSRIAASKTLPKEHAKCSVDEMEKLYKSLEQASLSPIGDRRPSTKKELRKSFIKRSKNPSVNEKLHKIRALNSTLKCKERDLAMINQLLEDPELTARKYREWKDSNTMLVQDIYQQQDVLNMSEGDSTEPETSLQPPFIESTI